MTQQQIKQNDTETPLLPESTLLYHYTSLESFLGIVESGTLWASHIRYLNDTSEQRLIWELFRTRIKERLQHASGTLHDKLMELKAVAANPQDEDIYVVSFSEDGGDRLSQWRGYGANEGIAVGFNPVELNHQCKKFTTKACKSTPNRGAACLRKVQYVDDSKKDEYNGIIDTFLDRGLLDFSTSKFTPEQAFVRGVSFFAATLKHTAFSDEREWRIIIFDYEGGPTPRYRARKSLLIPFIELDIKDTAPPKIFVGPSPHKENTVTTIKHLLIANGSNGTEVIPSQIPYRDW